MKNKFFAIFWRTFLDKKYSLLVYTLAAAVFLWMYVALYPTVQQEAEKLNEMMEAYPEAILKVLSVESISFSTLEDFVSMEYFSMIWPLMAIIFVLSFSGFALSREVELGTAEITLSRPVSRMVIYFSRYLTGLFMLVIFTSLSIFCVAPIAEIYNVDYRMENFITAALLSFLFAWAVYSMGTMFSAMFSDKGKVYMAAGGLLILMYVVNVIANFKEAIENIHYASFFYYYNFSESILKNNIDSLNIIVFVSVAVAATAIGAVWFQKRDIAI